MMIKTACQRCSEIFDAHSFRARYCSDRCRKAASRERAKSAAEASGATAEVVTAQSESPVPASPMYERTLAELRAVNRDGTALALGALYLARQLDMLVSSPGALPGQLVAQHAAALARALSNSASSGAVAGPPGGLADIIGGSGGLVAYRGGRS